MNIVRESYLVMQRELRPTFYDPISPVFSMGQPLIFLALYGPLLASSTSVGEASPWQWFVPGILVMIALFSTSMTGSNLQYEMQTGSHERILVTPIRRSSLIIGRSLKEMVPLAMQAVVVIVAVLPFGFRLYPLGALLGLLMLAVFGVGLGALSYALALLTRGHEWLFWAVQQTITFPLLILSGMMLPLDGAPTWMRTLTIINPFTYIVEAERALFAGDYSAGTLIRGSVAALALAVVGLGVGIWAMRRDGE